MGEPMELHLLQELADAPEEAHCEILLPLGQFALAFLVVYFVGQVLVGRSSAWSASVIRTIRRYRTRSGGTSS
jgi:hypothetical protein